MLLFLEFIEENLLQPTFPITYKEKKAFNLTLYFHFTRISRYVKSKDVGMYFMYV